jgi:hypothetical protein
MTAPSPEQRAQWRKDADSVAFLSDGVGYFSGIVATLLDALDAAEADAREAVETLEAISGQEPEGDHGEADGILLGVVPADVRDAYTRLTERARWWATA